MRTAPGVRFGARTPVPAGPSAQVGVHEAGVRRTNGKATGGCLHKHKPAQNEPKGSRPKHGAAFPPRHCTRLDGASSQQMDSGEGRGRRRGGDLGIWQKTRTCAVGVTHSSRTKLPKDMPPQLMPFMRLPARDSLRFRFTFSRFWLFMEIGLGPVLTNESWRGRLIEASSAAPELMMGGRFTLQGDVRPRSGSVCWFGPEVPYSKVVDLDGSL